MTKSFATEVTQEERQITDVREAGVFDRGSERVPQFLLCVLAFLSP
jgi:hypothetical protein